MVTTLAAHCHQCGSKNALMCLHTLLQNPSLQTSQLTDRRQEADVLRQERDKLQGQVRELTEKLQSQVSWQHRNAFCKC